MENAMDFLRAAMPWIAIGLLLVIFFAKKARAKKEKAEDYGTQGMCLGMCFGSAIGASYGNHIGLCMTLGMLIGLVIGTCIKKKEDEGE